MNQTILSMVDGKQNGMLQEAEGLALAQAPPQGSYMAKEGDRLRQGELV